MAEFYKHGGPRLIDKLTTIYQEMWRHGQVAKDSKDMTVVRFCKWKESCQLCDEHGGIMLSNTVGKIFARSLLSRVNGHLEQALLSESLCEFQRHYKIRDMMFAGRQLEEECQEIRTLFCVTFVDHRKAFGMANCDGLWKFVRYNRFTLMVASSTMG
ncbi:hypothetical protein SprV_0401466300 [Sparganum proliferum]